MPYTMADFKRDFMKEHFPELTPEEQKDVLRSLSPERLLAALSEEQIRYLNRVSAERRASPRKPRRKK